MKLKKKSIWLKAPYSKKNSNVNAWGPNVKQKIRGNITFINSMVKLKKFKHFTKKNQIENLKSKERGSNLKLR
jgi:hypothetical protein